MAKPVVVVFTKPSRAGRVKTRLVGDLSAEQAAELHAAFLADLATELVSSQYDLAWAWALDDGDAIPAGGVSAVRQRGADLGERLFHGLADLGAGRPAIAAVGSDAPTLRRERVEAAFQALADGADVCLGPADDGGYYLIALRAATLARELFRDIAWSTAAVCEQTVAVCRARGLRVTLLPAERDVDTPADLAWLADALSRNAERCPRTRHLLDGWGLLAGPARARA